MKLKEDGWKLVGHLGIDAGICWIGDPCYILHTKELPGSVGKNWGDFCEIINAGEITSFGYDSGEEGLGICVSTGWGDGYYPVYARLEQGRVMQIYIDFNFDG